MPYLTIKLDENGVPMAKAVKDAVKPASPPSDAEVESYIREVAAKKGVDPTPALITWERGGKGTWWSKASKGGRKEPSAGPFQFLKGGKGTGYPTGLGNQFQQETGLDPHDPKNWQKTVEYAFDIAGKDPRGWASHWYGYRAAQKAGQTQYNAASSPSVPSTSTPTSASSVTPGRLGLPAPTNLATPVGDVIWDKFGMKKTPSSRSLPTGAGFERVNGTLEDVCFATLTEQRRRPTPVAAAA